MATILAKDNFCGEKLIYEVIFVDGWTIFVATGTIYVTIGDNFCGDKDNYSVNLHKLVRCSILFLLASADTLFVSALANKKKAREAVAKYEKEARSAGCV